MNAFNFETIFPVSNVQIQAVNGHNSPASLYTSNSQIRFISPQFLFSSFPAKNGIFDKFRAVNGCKTTYGQASLIPAPLNHIPAIVKIMNAVRKKQKMT